MANTKKVLKKRLGNIFVILILHLCASSLIAQDDEFRLFTTLSLNPFDSITLEKIESHSDHNNWRELYFMLKSNCQLGRSERVYDLLLGFTDYNFELNEITVLLYGEDILIQSCMNIDSTFIKSYVTT